MGYKPNITFSSNSEDWEEHKLSEFMSFSNGFNGGKELYGCGVKYISVVDILNNDYIKYDNIQGNVNIDDATFARFCVNYGDVLFQRSSENVDDAGKSNVYIDDTPAAFGGFVIRGKRIAEFDPFFMKHLLDSGKVRKQITAKAQGAQHINVSQEILSDIKIYTPMTEQQLSIGALFRNVNNLIATHKQKQDELIRVKKYMLQKMFPKNGERVPKVRFAGFTDAWEQRKLSDLIIEYKETVDSDCTLPILTSSKTEGVVLQEEHFGRVQNHDITGYNILPRNYCTYRNRSDGVDFTFNINRCCDKGIISKFYPVFYGNNSDIFFISMVLNYCDEVVHEIAYTCTGTGQKVLSFLDLQKMNIRVPSYDEQKKISQFFEQLDNLITLHQRKCKDLKELKKYMLQNMFPKKG